MPHAIFRRKDHAKDSLDRRLEAGDVLTHDTGFVVNSHAEFELTLRQRLLVCSTRDTASIETRSGGRHLRSCSPCNRRHLLKARSVQRHISRWKEYLTGKRE